MRIKLTPKEEKNVQIITKSKRELSKIYLKDRDDSWEELVLRGEEEGKKFWNGLMYSFEGFMQNDITKPIIYLGEMEYKDRLFKRKLGEEKILNRYGKDNLLIHTGVCVIILTKDKKFIVGRKRTTVGLERNIYSHIGGNLNKDEMSIKSFTDIYSYMFKEMKEEIPIRLSLNKLNFYQISFFDSYCGFDFIYYSVIESKSVKGIKESEEFLSFEALDLDQILNLKEKGISDFEYSKNYLEEILLI